MTKEEALHSFFGQFLTAYEENAVPTGQAFPYLTYTVITDSFGAETLLTVSLWYRSSSWLAVNEMTEEISRTLGAGGIMRPCDGGAVWIKRAEPFAQSMGDSNDDMIKRKIINISAEYLTAD